MTNIAELLSRSREGGYAVGYFESWSLESIQGVLDAAEQTRSPVIIGFNGEFLTHGGRRAIERVAIYGALGKAAAESSSVPCGLVFNECTDDRYIREAIEAGFNLVLPAMDSTPYDEAVRRLKEMVPYAHQRKTAVEAELGELPCGASGRVEGKGMLTDPTLAAQFIEATGVDLLAVSVGNVHIQVTGEQSSELDLDRLSAIRRQVSVPLALHGGTGISAPALRKAIQIGVAKVNYGTYIKQRYLKAMRKALGTEEINPHELLGLGGEPDVLIAGRFAVRDAVLERLETLNCCGKA
ncbi:MAG: class II fructose-bisphosphate aldolase [Pirellulales bacterium]|nr:class II fructose-bisphosphate aldolase [Pirellulales bacterium]